MELVFVAFCAISFSMIAASLTSKRGKKTITYWTLHRSIWWFGTFAFLAAYGTCILLFDNSLQDRQLWQAVSLMCFIMTLPAAVVYTVTKRIVSQPLS